MDLDAVKEIAVERRLQHRPHVRMVVAEAGEALAGVHVEVLAPGGVVEVGAAGGDVLLVEPEDPQHVDERRVEVARGQLQRLATALVRLGEDAEGVRRHGGSGIGVLHRRSPTRSARAMSARRST